VTFTLDDLDIDGDADREPFVFTFPDGDSFEFKDPEQLPYRVLIGDSTGDDALAPLRYVAEQLKAAVPRYDALVARPEATSRMMTALLSKWRAHYALPSAGKAPGSSLSSSGTGKQSKRT